MWVLQDWMKICTGPLQIRLDTPAVYHTSMLSDFIFTQQKQTHISSILYSDISTWCYMGLLKRKSRTH